jgi:4-hydroxybenzoate polyprenyltransferase
VLKTLQRLVERATGGVPGGAGPGASTPGSGSPARGSSGSAATSAGAPSSAAGAVTGPRVTGLVDRLVEYARLVRLERPIGIWLLMWPTLWALWLSSAGRPNEHVFVVFFLGCVLMRSAGCAINDYADREFDGHVERTRQRPVAAGRLDAREAVAVYVALSLCALGLVLTLSRITVYYALAGGFLAVVYPFLKRFFPLPQLWLGAAFSWSIPMAYAAHLGTVPRTAWLLFIAGVLWSAVYDTMYAMVDRNDDLKIGVKSAAILFGDSDRVIVGSMQAMVLVALWLVGENAVLGRWYTGALVVGAGLFVYQQWLIRNREREPCFRAFLNNHWFGLVIFAGIALDYLFTRPATP